MDRSTSRFIEFPRDVKLWLREGPPPVDAARPVVCPVCGLAACDERRGLTIYGHGLRRRVQWGPPSPALGAGRCAVPVRRYQCQRCDAILVVGPRGIERHKRYSGPAIAFALALWALASRPEPEVFERVSVFELSPYVIAHGWRSLRRWTRDATLGALWPRLRARAADCTWRQRAERIAAALTSFAPDPHVGSLAARAFEGAKHAGRG